MGVEPDFDRVCIRELDFDTLEGDWGGFGVPARRLQSPSPRFHPEERCCVFGENPSGRKIAPFRMARNRCPFYPEDIVPISLLTFSLMTGTLHRQYLLLRFGASICARSLSLRKTKASSTSIWASKAL